MGSGRTRGNSGEGAKVTIESDLYLNLMKKSLLNLIYGDGGEPVMTTEGREVPRAEARETGLDWPHSAMTMVGMQRLNALQACVERILADGVNGDLIEAGVWRGGASIFMRAILAVHNDNERLVWVANSFMGCPPPDIERYPQDDGLDLYLHKDLSISRSEVERNFRRYDLLDDRVRFLEGWFKNTLHSAPIDKLALIRLDGDLYESTMDALSALYPKLSTGGYVIVDDFGAIEACQQAVDDYRNRNNVTEPISWMDWTGAYWRKA